MIVEIVCMGTTVRLSEVVPSSGVLPSVISKSKEDWIRDEGLSLSYPKTQSQQRKADFLEEIVTQTRPITLRYAFSIAARHHIHFQQASNLLFTLNNGVRGWWLEVKLPAGPVTDSSTFICFRKIGTEVDENAIPTIVPNAPWQQNLEWKPTDESKHEWRRLKDIMEAYENDRLMVALGGDPSIGKTYIAQHHALNGRECFNVTLNEDTFSAELKGHAVVTPNGMAWFDGPAIRAYRTGGRIVINEIQRASANTLSFLLELTESSNSAAISLPPPSNETIKPHPNFQVIASYNGDFDEMPEALKSRFTKRIHLKTANPDAIMGLPDYLRMIAAKTVTLHDVERRISLRHWYDFVDMQKKGLPVNTAAWALFGDQAEEILNQIKLSKA